MLRPGLNGSVVTAAPWKNSSRLPHGIVDDDQVLDVALVGQRARAARYLGADLFEPRRQRVERGGVRHLPAEEADALPAVGVDHQALLAVVHAERHGVAGLVDLLQAEEVHAVGGPVLQALGANTDVSQRLDAHMGAPWEALRFVRFRPAKDRPQPMRRPVEPNPICCVFSTGSFRRRGEWRLLIQP